MIDNEDKPYGRKETILVLILTNGKIYLDGSWKTGLDLLVAEGKIADIKPQGSAEGW
jgi:hypothetical protein